MKHIPLSRGLSAIVDDDDWYRLAGYPWRALKDSRTGEYRAIRSLPRKDGKRPTSYMAREVLKSIPDGMEVDHINHNTLDNRKANLRIVSHAQNMQNRVKSRSMTSKFKGVYFHKVSGKWMARLSVNGQTRYLGIHEAEQDAAAAYDAESRRAHGQYGAVNSVQP